MNTQSQKAEQLRSVKFPKSSLIIEIMIPLDVCHAHVFVRKMDVKMLVSSVMQDAGVEED